MLTDRTPSDAALRLFLEIAKDESLTKTAERLNVSQPSLSQHLHQLEKALGQRLMERHGRGLCLTGAGKELEYRLHGVFHHIDLSLARFRNKMGQTSGTVSIAGVHSLNLYFLPPVAGAFSAEFPDVHLNVLGRTSTEAAKVVSEGHADIGLLYGTNVTDERLAMLHLYNETMVVGCAAGHKFSQRIRDEESLPRQTPMVAFPRGCSVRNMIERAFPPGHLVIKAEVEALDTMLSLVSTGIGIAILPARIPSRFFEFYGLERLVLAQPKMMREVNLIFRKDVEQPLIIQTLVRNIRTAARAIEPQEAHDNFNGFPAENGRVELVAG